MAESKMKQKKPLRVDTNIKVAAHKTAERGTELDSPISPCSTKSALPTDPRVLSQALKTPSNSVRRPKKASDAAELKRLSQRLRFAESAPLPDGIAHKEAAAPKSAKSKSKSKAQAPAYNFSRPQDEAAYQQAQQGPPEGISHTWAAPPPKAVDQPKKATSQTKSMPQRKPVPASKPEQQRRRSQGRGDRTPHPSIREYYQPQPQQSRQPTQPARTAKSSPVREYYAPQSKQPTQPKRIVKPDDRLPAAPEPSQQQWTEVPLHDGGYRQPRNDGHGKALRDLERSGRGRQNQKQKPKSFVSEYRWVLFLIFIILTIGGGALAGALAAKK